MVAEPTQVHHRSRKGCPQDETIGRSANTLKPCVFIDKIAVQRAAERRVLGNAGRGLQGEHVSIDKETKLADDKKLQFDQAARDKMLMEIPKVKPSHGS